MCVGTPQEIMEGIKTLKCDTKMYSIKLNTVAMSNIVCVLYFAILKQEITNKNDIDVFYNFVYNYCISICYNNYAYCSPYILLILALLICLDNKCNMQEYTNFVVKMTLHFKKWYNNEQECNIYLVRLSEELTRLIQEKSGHINIDEQLMNKLMKYNNHAIAIRFGNNYELYNKLCNKVYKNRYYIIGGSILGIGLLYYYKKVYF